MGDRAVSVTVSYVLTLAITTALISGLLIGAGTLVDSMRDSTTRDGYEVAGHRTVGGLQSADRLAANGAESVELEVELPSRVAGTQYTISINNSSDPPQVVVQGEASNQQISIPFKNTTAVDAGTVGGGDILVILDSDGKLEVQEAG